MHNESIVLTPYYHGRVLNDLDVMRIAGKFAVISGSLVDLRKENVLHFVQEGLFHVVELTFARNRAERPVWVVAVHRVNAVHTCCSSAHAVLMHEARCLPRDRCASRACGAGDGVLGFPRANVE